MNLQTVHDALAQNTQSGEQRKAAEAFIAQCQETRGFVEILVQLISSVDQCSAELRLMASIILKNTVQRHWKARGRNAYTLGDDEKAALKAFILQRMDEPADPVAKQLQEIVAKLARFDWPASWGELFPALIQTIQSGSDLMIARATATTHRVLKELAGKRLLGDKRNYSAMSVQLFPVVSQVWLERSEQLRGALGAWAGQGGQAGQAGQASPGEDQLLPLAVLVTHLTKVMLRTILNGVGAPGGPALSMEDLGTFFQALAERQNQLFTMLTARIAADHAVATSADQYEAVTERALPRQLCKLLYRLAVIPVEVQKDFPLAFRHFLAPFLNFFHDQLMALYQNLPPAPASGMPQSMTAYPYTPGTSPRGLERVACTCLRFLTNTLCSSNYDMSKIQDIASPTRRVITSKGDQQVTPESVQEAATIIGQFSTPERLAVIYRFIVDVLLPLRACDLEHWSNDPETYEIEQESLADEKRCPRELAGDLLLSLIDRYPPIMAPLMVADLSDFPGQVAAAAAEAQAVGGAVSAGGELIPTAVIIWEARYQAAGICAYYLSEHLSFTDWFLQALAPALEQLTAGAVAEGGAPPALRRRILYLLQCWINDLSDEVRPALYQALVGLLGHPATRQDCAVAITLLGTMNALLINRFNPPAFAPVAQPAIRALYEIFNVCSEFDSRQKVLDLLSLLIEKLAGLDPDAVAAGGGQAVQAVPQWLEACAEDVVRPLETIWTTVQDQNILRKSVVRLLSLVVSALGPRAVEALLEGLILPILQLTTDLASTENEYLREDGLELWVVTMRQCPGYSEALHGLFPRSMEMLTQGDGSHELSEFELSIQLLDAYIVIGGETFLGAYAAIVAQTLTATIDTVSFSGEELMTGSMELLLQAFPAPGADMLRQGGTLATVLSPCIRVLDCLQAQTQPNPADIKSLTLHLSTLARVLFVAPAEVEALLAAPPVSDGSPQQIAARLVQLVDLWLERFDALPNNAGRRKVWAFALVSLLPFGQGIFLNRLDQILNMCLDVLSDDVAPVSEFQAQHDPTLLDFDDDGNEVSAAARAPPGPFYAARLTAIEASDSVAATNLHQYLQQKMGEAKAVAGDAAFNEALAAVEPVILQQLQS